MHVPQQLTEWQEHYTALRHDIHAHPELGFQEHRTSDIVAEKLGEYGWDVTRGIGGTGVVGTLKNGTGTRTIGLRADMDALPITEKTGLPYASTNPGVMHACGHDGHTTTLLAAARYLAETRDFDGTIHVIFQPAEEGLGGAPAMIKDGLFDRFPCDYIFAVHAVSQIQAVTMVQSGAILASSDRFTITLNGKSAHGAEPQNSKDPIVAAAAVINALQSVVARNVAPEEAAVVTAGALLAGNEKSYNIIPDSARINLSVRALSAETREMVLDRITTLATEVGNGYGMDVDIDHYVISPVTINAPVPAEIALHAATEVLGEENVVTKFKPFMNSEDFSFMLAVRPGAYVPLDNGDRPTAHQSTFDFNDDLIPLGAAYFARLAHDYLREG
jgi:hippurate hydrolase